MRKSDGVYIKLFHGRPDIKMDMDDWGECGPIFGPVPYAHTTYSSDIKCGDEVWLNIIEDCVYYDGMYYGDWSVFPYSALSEKDRSLIQRFMADKSRPPVQESQNEPAVRPHQQASHRIQQGKTKIPTASGVYREKWGQNILRRFSRNIGLGEDDHR